MLDLGHESGEGALGGTLVAGEALVAVLHAPGRVATDIDAQLVDVGRLARAAGFPPLASSEIVGWNVGWEAGRLETALG